MYQYIMWCVYMHIYMYVAWDLSVALMAIGEVAVIKTSPRFAYGKHGR